MGDLHARLRQACPVSAQELREMMAGYLNGGEGWTAFHVAVAD